jgi:hypothetical protein
MPREPHNKGLTPTQSATRFPLGAGWERGKVWGRPWSGKREGAGTRTERCGYLHAQRTGCSSEGVRDYLRFLVPLPVLLLGRGFRFGCAFARGWVGPQQEDGRGMTESVSWFRVPHPKISGVTLHLCRAYLLVEARTA